MYRSAPEVEEIALDVIRKVDRHKGLLDARIEYVFIDTAPRSHGRLVWGRARRIGGLNAFLAATEPATIFGVPTALFVIEISHDIWERLSPAKREALVDHELCHCHCEIDGDGNPVLSTRGHDFEEFAEIVERHGLWNTGTTELGAVVAEQLAFAMDEVVSFAQSLDDKRKTDGDDETAGES